MSWWAVPPETPRLGFEASHLQGGEDPRKHRGREGSQEAFSKRAFAGGDRAQPCGNLENLRGTPSAFSRSEEDLGSFFKSFIEM